MGTSSTNLNDIIKKYWDNLYNNQNSPYPSTAARLDYSQLPQGAPVGNVGTQNEVQNGPQESSWVNNIGAQLRNRLIAVRDNRNHIVRAPRKNTPSPVPNSRIRVTRGTNLANDANVMNPGIDIGAINAKFAEQMKAANANPADDIMAQIDSILNGQHGTPDRWVSPYSQADLDRIGAGLAGAGQNAAQQFDASKTDINQIYDEAINRRAGIQSDLAGQLASNLSNIGIQPGAPEADAAAAQQFLNTTSNQNRATDLAFNEKLGTMSNALGMQLANAARAGLLTPKQFVQGNEGSMSDADKFRLGLLTDQLDKINEPVDDGIDTDISETFLNENPLVPQMISSIQDPALREEATRLYDLKGSPDAVLSELAARLQQPKPIPTNRPGFAGNILNQLFSQVNDRRQTMADEQAVMTQQLIDLFRQISPTWQGVPTKRTVTQSSKS